VKPPSDYHVFKFYGSIGIRPYVSPKRIRIGKGFTQRAEEYKAYKGLIASCFFVSFGSLCETFPGIKALPLLRYWRISPSIHNITDKLNRKHNIVIQWRAIAKLISAYL
jgi:hypothetical protein